MQFHILNENYTPVAVMDNDLPDSINFNNSKFHRFLTGSADFFDFETSKLNVDHQLFQVGYWLAFRYDDRDRLQYINEISEAESDKMMTISSASSNLDLNNETKQPFSATEAKPFKWYFDIIMFDTGYEIGLNEISNLTRKLSWESGMTIRAFIQSVATQFDNAELDYEVILNSDFTIKKRLVHIKKKIGEVRDDIELRYGDNVKTVKRTTSISEICTAVRPVSKDDNDKVVDISSLNDWQELDEKGNVKFFHKKGSNLIFAPQANDRFGNRGTNVTGGGYIVHDFSYDNVSQSELFNRAHIYLKEHSVPAINYEVEGRTVAKIGDTVKIVDNGYTPPLILSARVLEQEISFDDPSKNSSTFTNVEILQSQVDQSLIDRVNALIEQTKPYTLSLMSDNGVTFKNSEGSTTLSAIVYNGTQVITPDVTVRWYKDDVWVKTGYTLEVKASDITDKAVYKAIVLDTNGNERATQNVTVFNVDDGKFGDLTDEEKKEIASHGEQFIAYAWSQDGTDRFTRVKPQPSMESLQDDYDNAVPRYIGRSLKDSNNPSDYKWEPNPERKPWTAYAQGFNGEDFSLMPLQELAKYIGTAALPYTDYTKYVWNLNPAWLQQESNNNLANKVDNDTYNNDQSTMWEEISNRVTEEEAQAIQESLDKITGAYTDFVSTGGKHDQDLANLKSAINTDIQKLADKVLGFDFVNTWFRIGDGGLSIGEANSNFEILVSNDQITFYDSGTAVAYVSNQSFFINSGMIVDDLQIGKFKFAKVNDNLMGLFHIA